MFGKIQAGYAGRGTINNALSFSCRRQESGQETRSGIGVSPASMVDLGNDNHRNPCHEDNLTQNHPSTGHPRLLSCQFMDIQGFIMGLTFWIEVCSCIAGMYHKSTVIQLQDKPLDLASMGYNEGARDFPDMVLGNKFGSKCDRFLKSCLASDKKSQNRGKKSIQACLQHLWYCPRRFDSCKIIRLKTTPFN